MLARAFNKTENDPFKIGAFVCLDPNAFVFGGWGNLLLSIFAVQAISLLTNRRAVVNHPLFTTLFESPIKTPWHLPPASLINSKKMLIRNIDFNSCHLISRSHFRLAAWVGVNGCFGSYIRNPELKSFFENRYNISQNATVDSYTDQAANKLASWTLSRPSQILQSAFDIYRNLVWSQCENTVEPDIGIQFRSWRDVKSNTSTFEESGGDCLLRCLTGMMKHMDGTTNWIRQSHKLCVFVTSDSSCFSKRIVDHLNNSNSSQQVQAFSSPSIEFNDAEWHSMGLIAKTRDRFNSSELAYHPELLDWMILGEIKQVLYSKGSTFATTARMRTGTEKQQNDFITSFHVDRCLCKSSRIRSTIYGLPELNLLE